MPKFEFYGSNFLRGNFIPFDLRFRMAHCMKGVIISVKDQVHYTRDIDRNCHNGVTAELLNQPHASDSSD